MPGRGVGRAHGAVRWVPSDGVWQQRRLWTNGKSLGQMPGQTVQGGEAGLEVDRALTPGCARSTASDAQQTANSQPCSHHKEAVPGPAPAGFPHNHTVGWAQLLKASTIHQRGPPPSARPTAASRGAPQAACLCFCSRGVLELERSCSSAPKQVVGCGKRGVRGQSEPRSPTTTGGHPSATLGVRSSAGSER